MRILTLFFLVSATTISAGIDRRIVGGRLVKSGEIPYQVSIRRSYNDYHTCGGTIITPKHILTAAHCMYYGWGGLLPPYLVSIVMGQLQLTTNSSSIYRNVTNIFIHPGYIKENMINDIAILELDKEIPNNNKLISGIPLNDRSIVANTSCIVSGWGVLTYGSFTLNEQLLATDVCLIDHQECQRRYDVSNILLSKGMMCAVNDLRPADACQGDSGGPLVCEGRLVGVISTGQGCANNSFPGIYSDVRFFLPWIEKTIGKKSESKVPTDIEAMILPIIDADETDETTDVTFEEKTVTTLVPDVTTVKKVQTTEQWNIWGLFSSSNLNKFQRILVIFVILSVFENLLL